MNTTKIRANVPGKLGWLLAQGVVVGYPRPRQACLWFVAVVCGLCCLCAEVRITGKLNRLGSNGRVKGNRPTLDICMCFREWDANRNAVMLLSSDREASTTTYISRSYWAQKCLCLPLPIRHIYYKHDLFVFSLCNPYS